MSRRLPAPAERIATPEEAEAALRALIGDHHADGRGPGAAMLLESRPRRGDAPEERLRKAEARYRALVERIPAITFLASMDQGDQEFYVSPQIEAILGFSQQEWLENPILWYEQLHPDDRDRWQSEFARTIIGAVPFRSEYRFIARDGRVVWVRGEAQMMRDPLGHPLFLQGIAFDITEQKEAEAILRRSREDLEGEVQRRTSELAEANRALQLEVAERIRADLALRDREARLRSIVESAVDGILVFDRAGTVEAFNPSAERIFGYPAIEVIGRSVQMLMCYDINFMSEGSPPGFAAGAGGAVDASREATGLHKDGRAFPMELAISETPTPEGIKFTSIVRDVTERKRGEATLIEAKLAAEAASRLKGEFLANMSHEIRTPMNGILGMTQMALGTELDPVQREYLEIVMSSADSLLILINDILDLSKVEAGKLDLDVADFDPRGMLADLLKPMAVRAHEKGLELACEIGPDVPDIVVGDSGRLRQVLINLVGNAVKFTPSGEVIVWVGRDAGPGTSMHSLRFSVRDSGIGIPADKQRIIFEAFTQADGSTTRRFGGTGLGLAISRKLVELMGGRIWVESLPGRGSTFSFTAELPRRPTRGPTPPADAGPGLGGVRVLIVDDNATSRGILERAVIAWGMVATLADSGPSGLEAIARAVAEGRPYPVVLLDAMMPGMDGFEFLRGLHADASTARASIMMLPSASRLADLVPCGKFGPGNFLIKPILRPQLLDAIAKVLSTVARPAPATMDRPPRDEAPRRSLRILLAEDNPVNQRIALRLLEKQGHRVEIAGDGRRALEILEADRFDLVIMDVQMPMMNGLQAMAAIRAREARTGGHIPAIALTANAMKGDREECLRAGFDDYLTKPIRWPQLEAAIGARIGDRRGHEASPLAPLGPAS